MLTHLKNNEYNSFRRKKCKKINNINKIKEEIIKELEKGISKEVEKIKDRSLKTH